MKSPLRRHNEPKAEPMSDVVVDPLTSGYPAPTHPRAWWQVMRGPRNRYLASGNAANISVTTPPTQAHTATLTIAGSMTTDVDIGITLPTSVTVILTQASATKGTQTAPVTAGANAWTGNYTTTFPANTLAAGTATATVSSVAPAETTTTPAFTLT